MSGIGDLVAHLTVDNAAFKAGLTGAQSSLKSFGSSIKGIASFAAPLIGVGAAVAGIKASMSGFAESLKSQQLLASVLTSTGGAAQLSMGQITDYAAELQKVTYFEDDATVSAAAMLATFTNIKGENFFSVIDAAADLSSVMGGDLQSNVKLLGKALDDPSEGFGKLSKQGVTFTEEQEKLIKSLQKSGDAAGAQGVILDQLSGKFGGAAEAVADPWTQLSHTLGGVGETIGSLLLPSFNVLADGTKGLLESVGGLGEGFKSFGIEAAVWVKHVDDEWMLMVTKFDVGLVQIGMEVAHTFTEVLPTYVSWFADQWQNIFFTAVDYNYTIFANLAENLRMLWRTVLDYFTGNPVEYDWTPLLEGAHNSIAQLPNIPERIVGDFERTLMEDVDRMSASLATSIADTRATLTAKYSPSVVPGLGTMADDEGIAAKVGKASSLKAAFRGSQEAASIMLRGVGGKSMEQIAGKQLSELQKLNANVKANKPQTLMAANLGT